jgi:1-aminocyclopropane-1-carboxylate synthase
MAESYAFVTEFFRSHSIPFYPGANAAFFIWCDLGAYYQSRLKEKDRGESSDSTKRLTIEGDELIMQKLLANKVFIAKGSDFGGDEPGWFRLVFTHPKAYLEEGLKRMRVALS